MGHFELRDEGRDVSPQLREWFPPFGEPVLVLVAVGGCAEDGEDGFELGVGWWCHYYFVTTTYGFVF
jgi:hypothetical protein